MRHAIAALAMFGTACFPAQSPRAPAYSRDGCCWVSTKVRKPRVEMSHDGEFDSGATKAAMRAVEYRDCGRGGAGRIVLVFGPSGSVVRSAVVDARYDPDAEKCVLERFHVVHVPPFTAEEEHAVGWRIWLPQPYESPSDDPEQDGREESPVPTSM
jgi:hypothetical protein